MESSVYVQDLGFEISFRLILGSNCRAEIGEGTPVEEGVILGCPKQESGVPCGF